MNRHKKFHKTDILISTKLPQINFSNFLEYFELEMEKIIHPNTSLKVSHSVKTVYALEKVWDKKISEPRRILLVDGNDKDATLNQEVKSWENVYYGHLISGRKVIKYNLSEGLLRMLEFYKLGLLGIKANQSLLLHLKHIENYYPCLLKLSHNADKVLRLDIIQCYAKKNLIDGDYFLT